MSALSVQPARVPIGRTSDGRDVFVTPEWQRYLSVQIAQRLGGASGQGVDELVTDLHDDAGIEELKSDVFRLRDEAWQMPVPQVIELDDPAPPVVPFMMAEDPHARIEALEARVAVLMTEIDALKQGYAL